MYKVIQTEEFIKWLGSIKDSLTKKRLVIRLDKASKGNLGDVKPIDSGIYEMREAFGSGWRMYYIKHGKIIILMVGGGNKSTQKADIANVKLQLKKLES